MTEEEEIKEIESDKSFELGIIEGYTAAAKELLEQSSLCFKRRHDDMAMKIRGLSILLEDRALQRRKEYDKMYPKEEEKC